MEGDLPGFAAPLHRALAEPILLAGAPRSLAIVNYMALRGSPTTVTDDRRS